jgi:spermidine/putrescine transport system ATP-binding protein
VAEVPFSDKGTELKLEGIRKEYPGFVAVENLDLTIRAGEFFALLGPSGCGKTTTLRMIAGLDDPTSGRILLGGQDITNTKAYQRPVNTVFQSYALFPHLTILENVAFGLRRRKVADATAQAIAALELVQLAHVGDRKPAQLSGGQQQRVALARAIVNRPALLLLDEPLGALDLKLRRQMQMELKKIQADVGLTFLHVTHDQEEAMTMADTVAVMNQGLIEQMGAPEAMYDLPRTAFVADFLGQSNIFRGQASAVNASTVEVAAGGTTIRVPAERAAKNSGDVSVGVRPEKMSIHAGKVASSSTRNALSGGRVFDVDFTGVSSQFSVDFGALGTVVVFEQNLNALPSVNIGDEVSVSWEIDRGFGLVDHRPAATGDESEL